MDFEAVTHVVPYGDDETLFAQEALSALARAVSPDYRAWRAYSKAWPEAMSGSGLVWPEIQWPV